MSKLVDDYAESAEGQAKAAADREKKERNIELYASRVEMGLGIFTGEPLDNDDKIV